MFSLQSREILWAYTLNILLKSGRNCCCAPLILLIFMNVYEQIKFMKQGCSTHISQNIVRGEGKILCTIIRAFLAIFQANLPQVLNFIDELIIIEFSYQIKS